mmetsp:Transcript_47584/g.81238  ORF Transcript_47584/g.81238 Transcript_47584/m.81238 type:complete len:185 (+) Transcript_47584:645-1199(+)
MPSIPASSSSLASSLASSFSSSPSLAFFVCSVSSARGSLSALVSPESALGVHVSNHSTPTLQRGRESMAMSVAVVAVVELIAAVALAAVQSASVCLLQFRSCVYILEQCSIGHLKGFHATVAAVAADGILLVVVVAALLVVLIDVLIVVFVAVVVVVVVTAFVLVVIAAPVDAVALRLSLPALL